MSDFEFATISVTGGDAAGFLQGQLTNDLRRLDGEERLLSAWCNPKGRVICLMQVFAIDGGFALVVPAELADEVARRLAMYRFRARVEFAQRAANAEDIGLGGLDLEEWRRERLRRGIPEIGPAQSEQFTPHMLNLDKLDALSLNKGCYTGQEVVARTHYRGATKRRTLRFESSAPVAPGQKVSDGERDLGEILNAIDTDVLAVLPVERANDRLTVGDTVLTPAPLPYF